MRGVIIYGPPAAGKDTVTAALHELDSRFALYRRLKVGPGRATGYRITDTASLDQLHHRGEVVWENHRYGARYAVDRPSLVEHLSAGVPIVHLGQRAAVAAVTAAVPDADWCVVYLWCPRHVAEQRIISRHTGDTAERLRAWDETEPLLDRDLFLNTAELAPHTAAERIRRHVLNGARVEKL
ncbi:guanylate kinase [Micromonospora pattaloongensis]|uniref:Guanylate kinase n=1 Tax=Micromonospora pattaloongensis TaxID=405436 RepID=A0A1H3JWL0_9ACTN|nr:kinase [Micromonospora pattaloongensis]SDY44316.1 guanylate kinase [Micromonospora pattaloongensis]